VCYVYKREYMLMEAGGDWDGGVLFMLVMVQAGAIQAWEHKGKKEEIRMAKKPDGIAR
jgi:hypothetical protein